MNYLKNLSQITGKNHMIIGARQEVLFALLDPFFLFVSLTLWTMPVTAGVIADGKISATVARVYMAAQGRSPAVG